MSLPENKLTLVVFIGFYLGVHRWHIVPKAAGAFPLGGTYSQVLLGLLVPLKTLGLVRSNHCSVSTLNVFYY